MCSCASAELEHIRASGHGFLWSGRRVTVIHMAKAWQGGEEEVGEAGLGCSEVLHSSHAVLSKPLKSALECSLDLLLRHSHTLPDYERFR